MPRRKIRNGLRNNSLICKGLRPFTVIGRLGCGSRQAKQSKGRGGSFTAPHKYC